MENIKELFFEYLKIQTDYIMKINKAGSQKLTEVLSDTDQIFLNRITEQDDLILKLFISTIDEHGTGFDNDDMLRVLKFPKEIINGNN